MDISISSITLVSRPTSEELKKGSICSNKERQSQYSISKESNYKDQCYFLYFDH